MFIELIWALSIARLSSFVSLVLLLFLLYSKTLDLCYSLCGSFSLLYVLESITCSLCRELCFLLHSEIRSHRMPALSASHQHTYQPNLFPSSQRMSHSQSDFRVKSIFLKWTHLLQLLLPILAASHFKKNTEFSHPFRKRKKKPKKSLKCNPFQLPGF